MKRIMAITIVFLMLLSTTFAGGATESSGTKNEIRVITFFAGSDQWAPVWKEVIADYQKAHPDVTIVDESQPTAGANDLFRTKVQSDIAARTPADLMLFYNGSDAKMVADSGLYVDIGPYLASDSEWSSNFMQSALDACKVDGVQLCLPYIGFYEGLFYNKALFDKYGLAEPTTWENFVNGCKVLRANGVTPIATPLAKPSYMAELMILSQVGAEGQKDYYSDSWIPALERIKDLYQMGAFPEDAMTLSEDDCRVLVQDGKAAMIFNGSWCTNAFKSNPDMRIISMPTLPGGVGGSNVALAGYGSGWYISKKAVNDGITLDFLKYITSPEIMARFIAAGGSPAIYCESPEGATNLEKSALEMIANAKATRTAIDSQVTRESWLTLVEPGISYICTGARSASEVLAEAKSYNY